jgi:LysM repeat protein
MIEIIKRFLILSGLGLSAFIIPPVILTAGSYAYYQSSELILSGVRLGSVDVGALSVGEAEQLIDKTYNQDTDLLLIEVPVAQRSWTVDPSEFGLHVSPAESARAAYEIGRQGSVMTQLTVMLDVLNKGKALKPVVQLDESKAEEAIANWATLLSSEPKDARIYLMGSQVGVQPAEQGLMVDVDRSMQYLTDSYESIFLEDQWLPLFTVQTTPDRSDVTQALDQVESILSNPPSIHAYDPVTDEFFTWTPDRETTAGWLSIKDVDHRINIEINLERIQSFIDGLSSDLGPERNLEKAEIVSEILDNLRSEDRESRLHVINYNPSEYIVQPGDTLVSISFKVNMPYWKLFEENPILETQGLNNGQVLKVPPRDDLLELPIIPSKRIVISISEQHMWVFEQGELKWEHIVSTGIPNSPTMPGIFQITSHYENAYASNWDLYMPHFMGIYDAVPGLTNGIHGLPILSNGSRLWANVLGQPASYGCIILDLEAAEQLYYWAEEGVVVEIRE